VIRRKTTFNEREIFMTVNSVKPDRFQIFIRIMDFVTWAIIFFALIYFDQARPQTRTILDMRYSKDIREVWEVSNAYISLWLFIAAAAVAGSGLVINIAFLGNRKYHISFGLSFGLIVSLCFAAVYLFILL
jgi:sterol desaturase/sphingolipid hydroxylase (fatty acid hydroxylase superfamily)